jgi:hypothetical protein
LHSVDRHHHHQHHEFIAFLSPSHNSYDSRNGVDLPITGLVGLSPIIASVGNGTPYMWKADYQTV